MESSAAPAGTPGPAAPAGPLDPDGHGMSPSLMADFRRGLSEGATADRTTPNQEGNP
jgi:hypothetical protein